jgi:FtsH-binding integral membrane protein
MITMRRQVGLLVGSLAAALVAVGVTGLFRSFDPSRFVFYCSMGVLGLALAGLIVFGNRPGVRIP